MSACGFIKASGDRCRAQAMHGSQWCYVHNPDYADKRQQNNRKGGRRGGRARPLNEVVRIQERLEELAESVMGKEVDRANAMTAGQLYNYALRAIDISLKVREQLELEERLSELEALLDAKKEKPWSASAR